MAPAKAWRIGASAVLALASPVLLGATANGASFHERVLAAHNRERISYGAPPLSWDQSLADGAYGWADHLAKTGRFAHSPDDPRAEPVGENIWGGTAAKYSPESMVNLWISEKRFFKPGTFPQNSTTGDVQDVSHYTQVMWRSSRRVGCAVSRGAREDILVCRYASAGNMIGEKPF